MITSVLVQEHCNGQLSRVVGLVAHEECAELGGSDVPTGWFCVFSGFFIGSKNIF